MEINPRAAQRSIRSRRAKHSSGPSVRLWIFAVVIAGAGTWFIARNSAPQRGQIGGVAYMDGATAADADHVWKVMNSMGWPDKNGEICAYLHRFKSGFEVEFVVRPGAFMASRESDVAIFANAARFSLSKQIYGTQPFVVAFCDEHRSPLKRFSKYVSMMDGRFEEVEALSADELEH